MSNRKTLLFYAFLIAIASLAVGMVIASRLDLTPASSAQTIGVPPANSAPLGGPIDATTFRTIAKNVTPAVVNIRTESKQQAQDLNDFFGGGGDDLFDRFFGGGGGGGQGQGQGQGQDQGGQGTRRRPREQTVEAAGSGFIIDKGGYILTNNHVVEGAQKIEVSLFVNGEEDDTDYAAKVVGRDPLTDSALIQLTEKPTYDLPVVKFGDSSQMQPGDWVMAIGNPFNLSHTVSVGVISATGRSFPVGDTPGRFAQVLQTDAAINPGNSGGPLLNVRGEVVGINTAIYTDARQQGNIGIGFAMPINVVRDLLPQLRSGKITRGMIGVQVGVLTKQQARDLGMKNTDGALVSSVSQNGAAAKGGMEAGDVILGFNGKPVKKTDDLVAMVMATKPGSSVPVRVLREGMEKTLTVTVAELDLEAESQQASRADSNPTEPQSQQSAGFGLTLQNITPDVARRLRLDSGTRGALITDVDDASPAARSGLQRYDIITSVNRVKVTTAAEAQRELAKVQAGHTAFLLVLRNGQERFVPVEKGPATNQ
ncbi:MAG TPA: trypsin-like peptidase domain-containing protein [Vicinamibacterales bacterium]|nr:trypsin-like peptidase domain-containing protein [Vicinamibacterales bacterium]